MAGICHSYKGMRVQVSSELLDGWPATMAYFLSTKIDHMEKRTLTIQYEAFGFDELSEQDRELVEAARKATYTSYAPYSHFCVGAAVRLNTGEIVSGSNQENAAFGAGTCAERCTMFYANAKHPDEPIRTIAIAARGTDGEFTLSPISPCGVCRQALIEAQKRAQQPIRVLLYGRRETLLLDSISCLLPFQFDEIV